MYSRAVLLERLQRALIRGALVLIAAYAAVGLRHAVFSGVVTPWRIYVVPALVAALVLPLVMWAGPTTAGHRLLTRIRLITPGALAGVGLLLALTFFLRGEDYSRATTLIFVPLAIFAILVADQFDRWVLERLRLNRATVRRVVVVGTGDVGRRVARAIRVNPAFYELVGFLDDSPIQTEDSIEGIPVLGIADHLRSMIKLLNIDEVIVATGETAVERSQDLLGACMAERVDWKVVPPMLGLLPDRVEIDHVGGLPVVGPRGSKLVGHNWYLKRALDIVVAGAAVVVTAPFMFLMAILIKATSPGPVIFRQRRIGLDGRGFTFLKFRTMRAGADTGVHQEYATKWIFGTNKAEGVHKLTADSRVTKVGRFLRATSLDELPQLWNVLRGDMSLVGPRPPLPYEVERYTEWHKRRLEVPPGVTGLWQVSGRNRLSFEEMITLDIDYIETWSIRRDITILLRTVPAVVFDRGR